MRPLIVLAVLLAFSEAKVVLKKDGGDDRVATLNGEETRQFGLPGLPGGSSGGLPGNPATEQLCNTVCLACNIAAPVALGRRIDGEERSLRQDGTEELDESNRGVDMCALYGEGHDMCLSEVGEKCGEKSWNNLKLSGPQQTEMIKVHNDYRRKIAKGLEKGAPADLPEGGNMVKLVWNHDLAEIAQRWADQCEFKHDGMAKRLAPGFDSTGQNIYVAHVHQDSDEVPVKAAVDGWYSEVINFTSPVSDFVFSHETGHFTQLIWGETSEVGCGYTKWWEEEKGYFTKMIVCDYGESGNWKGEEIYVTGAVCTECPDGWDNCEDGLCTV